MPYAAVVSDDVLFDLGPSIRVTLRPYTERRSEGHRLACQLRPRPALIGARWASYRHDSRSRAGRVVRCLVATFRTLPSAAARRRPYPSSLAWSSPVSCGRQGGRRRYSFPAEPRSSPPLPGRRTDPGCGSAAHPATRPPSPTFRSHEGGVWPRKGINL